jgi:hypothetical protein
MLYKITQAGISSPPAKVHYLILFVLFAPAILSPMKRTRIVLVSGRADKDHMCLPVVEGSIKGGNLMG